MILRLKNLLFHHAPLKIISIIVGFFAWYYSSNQLTTNQTFVVPICFYNLNTQNDIYAPDEMAITLQAKRSILRALAKDSLAVHINAGEFSTGMQPIRIERENLFLPEGIKLVECKPLPITIRVEKKA